MALLSWLAESTDERPDAVRVDDRSMSWVELRRAATAVADELRGARRVAVPATTSLETVVGVVGGLLAGAAVVPVPPDAGPVERDHILRDSGAEALVTPPGAGSAPLPVVPVDLTRRSDTRHPEPDAAATALILYTSGTTGAPKGAVLSRRAVAACLDGLADAWAWTPDDLLAHGLPLFHVHGLVLGVLGPLRVGSRLRHVGRPRPDRYAAAGGSLYFGVPTIWSRIAAEPAAARALRGARLLVSGSAALPEPVFAALGGLTGHRPVERYGMTETLITVSARADGPRRPGTVGVPLPGVRTRVVDEHGAPLPADGDAMGELQVRGETLFDGYLNRPDADAAARTADGWFRTGDVATVGPDGWHRIVGRAATDLIKSGGYRIGAGEVEDALLAHPGVREAAVVGLPHPDLGQQVTAYVVGDGLGEAELIDFVARQLSVHKRPRQVRLVDALPRNAMGKVQKSRLAEG
ncbi:acyl-CoA synthetase [Micromonospora sp. WMMD1128]|uniref:acyl-CoA synthetase n=1 Tax=unclassified Micromonospora TaxID=2617518 RepID=UPI00248BFCA8|nr:MULTISPECIES: acyl-CoA synthetase [unclassified Micromonospora]WBB76659.1 acyl-CoA synthetase [Micromonospora sp. WMMD1128]WFE35553.1 acyl-CoA synthetase [Micromonospora sp. WMMD975]